MSNYTAEQSARAGQEWIDLGQFMRPEPLAGIVGQSEAMKQLLARVARLAPHKGTVLIQGESGSGKELIARALHQLGVCSRGPLISFNCSNLVEGLAESQLFGHVKGAFTDAREAHPGCFRQANGGTLLLDEIGELPLGMQAKLLRVTERFEVQAVGSPQTFPLDLRLIAATNRDLRTMVAAGQFRADLFYRLEVAALRIPPIRERPDDIPLLAAYFADLHNRAFGKTVHHISQRALDLLAAYEWPGNVRELAHALEGAILLTEDERIDIDDLPEDLLRRAAASPRNSGGTGGSARSPGSSQREPVLSLDGAMKAAVQRSLEHARGDCARAARLLGISRPAIYRKMARFGITNASLRQYRGRPSQSVAS